LRRWAVSSNRSRIGSARGNFALIQTSPIPTWRSSVPFCPLPQPQ
jgi:hypothetical protein